MYKVKGIMYMIHSVALVIADFLFSKDVITEEEKEVLGGLLDKVVETITKDIKNFEQTVKLHNNNRYEIHSNSNN